MSKIEFEFDIPATLPDGWKWMPLEELMDSPKQDIVDGPFGSNLKASEYVDEGVPIARLQNVDRNAFVHKNIKYVTRKKADELSRHTFKPGDILITKLGDPLGEACIAPSSIEQGLIVADLVRVRPAEKKVDHRYLTYAINSPLVSRQFEKHTKGTTRPRVNLGMIRQLPIPVAPRDMQVGVVAEIEKQFSRLDEAVANLKRVKANLMRYKAAVLKAAVEGRLVETEAELARREGRSYETGEQLLQHILVERRQKWEEAELAKMKEKGKTPKDDKWTKKYIEPILPDTTDLPEMPEGWVWATAEQVSGFITKGATPSAVKLSEGSGEVQFLKVYNLTFDGTLNHTYKPAFVSRKTHEGELGRSKVQAGDVLINIVGPPLGQVAVIPPVLAEANINQAIARFRPTSPLSSEFLSLTLLTDDVMRWAIRRAKTTAGQSNLTLELCRALPIPLPPTAEQGRIVTEVDRRLSIVRETAAQVDVDFRRSERLRQSILATMFSDH